MMAAWLGSTGTTAKYEILEGDHDGQLLLVEAVLLEEDVIDAVRDHLSGDGWEEVSRATVKQTGEDLVTRRDSRVISIEAKGQGSSTPTSTRYGQPLTRGQVLSHVSRAEYMALAVASASGAKEAAAALPADTNHVHFIHNVASSLSRLSIGVFWVDSDAPRHLGRTVTGEEARPTLHEEIIRLLREAGTPMSTGDLALRVNEASRRRPVALRSRRFRFTGGLATTAISSTELEASCPSANPAALLNL